MSTTAETTCEPFGVCFRREDCWDGEEETATCWTVTALLIIGGTLFIFFAEAIPRNSFFSLQYHRKQWQKNKKEEQKRKSVAMGIPVPADPEEELRNAFINSRRSEENFILNNDDPDLCLPNAYGPEYVPNPQVGSFFPITGFFSKRKKDALLGTTGAQSKSLIDSSVSYGSIGVSLLCMAAAGVLQLKIDHDRTCNLENPYEFEEWVKNVGIAFSSISRDFAFYPIFLLVGYLGFVVARWREWLVNCHVAQGKIHDIAMLCGASTIGHVNLPVRKKLYKIYRYLNLLHALLFKSVSSNLGPMSIDFDFVYNLRLLTPREARVLLPMDNKLRDTVHTWVSAEIASFLRMDGVDNTYANAEICAAIRELRAACGKHHDMAVRDNPNLYLDVLLLVTNLWILLTIVGYPFRLLVQTPMSFEVLGCLQPLVGVGVFVILSTIRLAFSLLIRLRCPFSFTVDHIEVDSFLASTERCIFATLRAQFDDKSKEEDDPYGSMPLEESFAYRSSTSLNTVKESSDMGADSDNDDQDENDDHGDAIENENVNDSTRSRPMSRPFQRSTVFAESLPRYNRENMVGVSEERYGDTIAHCQNGRMRQSQNQQRYYLKERPVVETLMSTTGIRDY